VILLALESSADCCSAALWDGTAREPEAEIAFERWDRDRVDHLVEMVEAVARATGLTPRLEWAPPQPGDVHLTAADTTRAERLLDWRPEVGFEEGMRRFAAWFGEQTCR